MPEPKDISFSERQRRAVKARWAKQTPEERSAYAKKMVEAREAKRQLAHDYPEQAAVLEAIKNTPNAVPRMRP